MDTMEPSLDSFLDDAVKKDTLFFELRDEDHVWKIYLSGHVEGFPENTLVINEAARFLNLFHAIWEKHVQGLSMTNKAIDADG